MLPASDGERCETYQAPASCTNLGGGYECECPEGVEQDSPYTCESTDSCARGEDNCHVIEPCTPILGLKVAACGLRVSGMPTCPAMLCALRAAADACLSPWVSIRRDRTPQSYEMIELPFGAPLRHWC